MRNLSIFTEFYWILAYFGSFLFPFLPMDYIWVWQKYRTIFLLDVKSIKISFWKIIIINDWKLKKKEKRTRVQTRAHDKIRHAQSNGRKRTVKKNCDISLIRSCFFHFDMWYFVLASYFKWKIRWSMVINFYLNAEKFLRKLWLTYLWNMVAKIPSTLT